MKWIFLALIIGLLVYEFVALANKNTGDTISEIVWYWSIRYPLIPFVVGVICGHFFWQRASGQ